MIHPRFLSPCILDIIEIGGYIRLYHGLVHAQEKLAHCELFVPVLWHVPNCAIGTHSFPITFPIFLGSVFAATNATAAPSQAWSVNLQPPHSRTGPSSHMSRKPGPPSEDWDSAGVYNGESYIHNLYISLSVFSLSAHTLPASWLLLCLTHLRTVA